MKVDKEKKREMHNMKEITIALEDDIYKVFEELCTDYEVNTEQMIKKFILYANKEQILDPEIITPWKKFTQEDYLNSLEELRRQSGKLYPNGLTTEEIIKKIDEIRKGE